MKTSPVQLVKLLVTVALLNAGALLPSSFAQELKQQVTPFSIYLSEAALEQNAQGKALPIWLAQVQTEKAAVVDEAAAFTTYRFYLRSMGSIGEALLLRVYFTDSATTKPEVSCWNELGDCLFRSALLGTGLDLPAAAGFSLNTKGVSYIEVKVPGAIPSLRGVFLGALQTASVWTAMDFDAPSPLNDPFGNKSAATPQTDDVELFHRIQATLDGEVTRLESPSEQNYNFEFQLASVPEVAVLTFEISNADITRPLIAQMNGTLLGAVGYLLPDLADPAYDESHFLADPITRVRYTGWMKVQKVISGAQLQGGWNQLQLSLQSGTEPVAIRNVSIQLKYPSNP